MKPLSVELVHLAYPALGKSCITVCKRSVAYGTTLASFLFKPRVEAALSSRLCEAYSTAGVALRKLRCACIRFHCVANAAVFSVVVVCFFSCNRSGGGKSNTDIIYLSGTGDKALINIEFDYETNTLPYDSLVDANDIFFVKLETTGNSLIGGMDQVLFTSDRIIVVDRFIAKRVMVFDKSGKFLNTIGQFGQGPEEYTYLGQVCLTQDEKMLLIHGVDIKYYMLDGKFVKSSKDSYMFDHIEFLTDNIIATVSTSGNVVDENNPLYKPRLIVMDIATGNILYSAYQSYYRKEFIANVMYPLKKFDNNVLFNLPFTDTVYLVTPEGLYPRYYLKMKNVPSLVVDENITNKDVDDHGARYPIFGGRFIDMKDVLYFRFSSPGPDWSRFVLYSKKQGKFFCGTGSYTNDPLFYFWSEPIAKYKDDYLVVDVGASSIMSKKDDLYRFAKNMPDKKAMLDELYRDLTEDDNPVLMFCRVKI